MAKRLVKHLDILAAKRGYEEGENVTELLRRQKDVTHNTPEIIEAAYDLQSGSYIEHVEKLHRSILVHRRAGGDP